MRGLGQWKWHVHADQIIATGQETIINIKVNWGVSRYVLPISWSDIVYAICATPCVTDNLWMRTLSGLNGYSGTNSIDITVSGITGASYPTDPNYTSMDYMVLCK